MKTLKFVVSTKKLNNPEGFDVKDIFTNNVMQGLHSLNEKGMTAADSRTLCKIMDKVDDVNAEKCDTLELEDAEFELVKKAFKDAKFPPNLCRVIGQFLDFLDAAELEAGK